MLSPEHVRPDYAGGGFLNLVASLVAARGGAPRHATLAALPPESIAGAQNLVFLIIDGLGDAAVLARPGSAMHAARRGRLRAVFPSTTASAITTSYTGCSPLEHGLTGWNMLIGDAGCVGSALPFKVRGHDASLATRGVTPAALFRSPSLFDAIADEAFVVSWNAILESAYNRHHCSRATRIAYASLEGLVDGIERAVKSGDGRKFVYAYWWQFDYVAHRHGVGSPEAEAQYALADAAFARLCARLAGTDTAIVASADHGFIDSAPPEWLALEDGPGLSALLAYPLCGERRIAWCHVQPGRAAEFSRRARDWLGARADVVPSRTLVDEGFLGPGEAHPRLHERIGDVAILMRGRNTLKDQVAGEARFLHIGNHGGTSADEMNIPLLVATP